MKNSGQVPEVAIDQQAITRGKRHLHVAPPCCRRHRGFRWSGNWQDISIPCHCAADNDSAPAKWLLLQLSPGVNASREFRGIQGAPAATDIQSKAHLIDRPETCWAIPSNRQ